MSDAPGHVPGAPLKEAVAGWRGFVGKLLEKGLPIGAIAGMATAVVTVHGYLTTRSVPVNINVQLESAVLAASTEAKLSPPAQQLAADREQMLPVSFGVEVENTSSYKTLLLHNPLWVAYGWMLFNRNDYANTDAASGLPLEPSEVWIRRQIEREFGDLGFYKQYLAKARKSMTTEEFNEELNLTDNSIVHDATKRRLSDHYYVRNIIGAGKLIGNPKLFPKEKVTATHIIPSVRGRYDIIEVRVIIPTTNEYRRRFLLSQRLTTDDVKAIMTLYEPYDRDKPTNPNMYFCRPIKSYDETCELLTLQERSEMGAHIQYSFSQLWVGM